MKLSKEKKLMGILVQEMTQNEVGELLAVSPSFSWKEKEECQAAPIRFLIALKKKTVTETAFVVELERLFKVCKFAHFLQTIEDLRGSNPSAQCRISRLSLTPSYANVQNLSEEFRSVLLKLSHSITKGHLEIMVALAPIPEASKEDIHFGYELFEKMERHGCIAENDVELLEDIFELLNLAKEQRLLCRYTSTYRYATVLSEHSSSHHPLKVGHVAHTSIETSNPSGGPQPSRFWRRPLAVISAITSPFLKLLQSSPTSNHQSQGRKRNRESSLDDAEHPPAKVSCLTIGSEIRPTQIFIAENVNITCRLQQDDSNQANRKVLT